MLKRIYLFIADSIFNDKDIAYLVKHMDDPSHYSQHL
jgi:hypothetical protein